MAAVKQTPKIGEGLAGPGRPKGVPNKTTMLLKDAIIQAATQAGNGDLVAYLEKQANDNPGPFMSLLGKVLPLVLAGSVDHIHHEIVEQRANKFTEAMQSLIERAESKARPN